MNSQSQHNQQQSDSNSQYQLQQQQNTHHGSSSASSRPLAPQRTVIVSQGSGDSSIQPQTSANTRSNAPNFQQNLAGSDMVGGTSQYQSALGRSGIEAEARSERGQRARQDGSDRVRQILQDLNSQIPQQVHGQPDHEERSNGSTQRERYTSQNQQQRQQSWPPVELYQQIDALIQQSSLQQQQMQEDGQNHTNQQPSESTNAQPTNLTHTNSNNSGQAQILRSILRQSSMPNSHQQQIPTSSLTIPQPVAQTSNQEINLMGSNQHNNLDDSMSLHITQQQILDSITSNRNTSSNRVANLQLENPREASQNIVRANINQVQSHTSQISQNLRLRGSSSGQHASAAPSSTNSQRLISGSQRTQLAGGEVATTAEQAQRRSGAAEEINAAVGLAMGMGSSDQLGEGLGAIDGNNSQSTMNEEQMNEIINSGDRRDELYSVSQQQMQQSVPIVQDGSSSDASDDQPIIGQRIGAAAARQRASQNSRDAMIINRATISNEIQDPISSSCLHMGQSSNNNMQIQSVQEQLRQRHQQILLREPRWASGAGPLESDDDFDDELQSNLILSGNRGNANNNDTDNSSNPSPPLASYNIDSNAGQNRNQRHVRGSTRAINGGNYDVISSSEDDSNDEDHSNNTSHEENMIASDPNFRRQQESNLNLRALGIRNTQNHQLNNLSESNRQNVFNRIISSHMNREQIESGNLNNRNLRARNNDRGRLAATGSNGYPILDDLDLNENDEIVSMNDSLNMLAINAANSRRPQQQLEPISQLVSQQPSSSNQNNGTSEQILQHVQINSNVIRQNNAQATDVSRRDSMLRSSAIRQMREEAKTNANQNIEEIFKCFICYSKIQDAVLCPSCSKLCCRDCIKKWLTEQRQQCPHCRCHLSVDRLINCRFVEEITAAIDTLNKSPPESARNGTLPDGNLLRNGNEICKDHGQRLDYFCQTCKTPICSECAMFGSSHKDHQFQRLQEVYEEHCQVIKKEAIGLKKRLKELTKYTQDVETTIEKVTKAKEEKSKEIENFNENIQHKLNTKLKNKLLTLWAQRQSMQDEIEQLEEFHNKLHLELTKMPKTSLIKKSSDLIRQLKEIHTKEPHKFIDNEVSIDFSSDIVPEYEQSIFIIKNFSRIRQNQSNQIQDDNEIVYSDPPLVTKSGLTWRLKVYPNGNGIAKGNYISVFLEMLKGLPEQQTQKYEYRVEMINHRTPSAQVVREFASEFEVGECWGYNRFYRIDLLDREGYLNTNDDSITLKFFVRAPCYSQHCQDQERHICNLENQIDSQNKEIELLKEKLAQTQRQLKKKQAKAAKKLRISNPSNGQQIQEESLEENDHSLEEDNSNENEERQKGLSEFLDSQKNQGSKMSSHQYLKDLKEKQKKNDQRMNQNQQQITQIISSKISRSQLSDKNQQQEQQKNLQSKANNPFIEDSKSIEREKNVSGPQSLQTNGSSLVESINQSRPQNTEAPIIQADTAGFYHKSSLAPADDESPPQAQENQPKRKDEAVKLNFYAPRGFQGQYKRNCTNADDEEDKINDESNDSHDSDKIDVNFKQELSAKKKYAKHNYVSEDNYDKIINNLNKNSESGSSEQKDTIKMAQNSQAKNQNRKNEAINSCHAPFKSDDESNQSDQHSMNSSSQNDEEKKEKIQYIKLQESLRQLQNRANATLENQQKLIMGGKMIVSPKEPSKKSPSMVIRNYTQNYSVSSGNDDDGQVNIDNANRNLMLDSNYDDQGISASASDNQASSSEGQQDIPYNASKVNIFGSPNMSTSNKLNANKKKQLMNLDNQEFDHLIQEDNDRNGDEYFQKHQQAAYEDDDDNQMIISSASPGPLRKIGIGLGTGDAIENVNENSLYIQSSKDSFDGQSHLEEDRESKILQQSNQKSKRQLNIRESEDIGTSLQPIIQNEIEDIHDVPLTIKSPQNDQIDQIKQDDLNFKNQYNQNQSESRSTNYHKKTIKDQNNNNYQSSSQSQSQIPNSLFQNQAMKIQNLRKYGQDLQESKIKQNKNLASVSRESQISSKLNFEQIQSSSGGAKGSSSNDGIGLGKFEESKSQPESSSSRQKSDNSQKLQISQKLNLIDDRTLDKKKLHSQYSVKGLGPQSSTGPFGASQQIQNSVSINFKKLANSNSNIKLSAVNTQGSQQIQNEGSSLSQQHANSKNEYKSTLSQNAPQQMTHGTSTQQSLGASSSCQIQSDGQPGSIVPGLAPSSNQKLLAGLNHLKQKRMLKQTMTLPNQTSQKKE